MTDGLTSSSAEACGTLATSSPLGHIKFSTRPHQVIGLAAANRAPGLCNLPTIYYLRAKIPCMKYQTYLFDFDYTLADSSRGIVLCFQTVLKANGYTAVSDDEVKRTIGKTLEESFAILTGVDDPDRLARFKQAYVQKADTCMTANTVFFPETLNVLHSLKEQGRQIGIISTKYRYRITEMFARHNVADLPHLIIGGEDVHTAKPSPEGVLAALTRLQADAHTTIYIGDSTVDAETARAAGVAFAGVTHGVTPADELARYPHVAIMPDLTPLLAD